MSDSSQIVLREYLLSLGFKADPVSLGRFTSILGKVDKNVMAVGKGLIGVASAAAAMVAAFTAAGEKAYYASKLGQSSVSNMKAAAYAGKQIGLTAEQVNGAILNLSMAIRKNPGVQALIESFGIAVEGRDMSDVISDVVAKLKELPFPVASMFAEKFGMDPQTYFLLAEGLDKYNAALQERKRLEEAAGVDEDKFAEASVKYQNALSNMTEKVGLLGKRIAVALLPIFEKLNDIIGKSLDFWIRWADRIDKVIDKVHEFNTWFRKMAEWNPLWKWMLNQVDPQPGVELSNRRKMSGVVGPNPDAPKPPAGGGVDLSAIELRNGLRPGTLHYLYGAESGQGTASFYGRLTRFNRRAEGPFQFDPPTAKQYGVDTTSLSSSAEGAGRYMRDLLKKYNGDYAKALGAYNWGPGMIDSVGLGGAPSETRKYVERGMAAIGGPQTTIIIQGVTDPQDAADRVEAAQDRVNADYVRNIGSTLQ